MKTEDFDRALRDKLNSINHTYSNSDIEKVFRHVKKGRRLTWKGLKGSWIFYSLSAAAMVTITTLVLYKMPSGIPGKKHEVTGITSNAGTVQDKKLITDTIAPTKDSVAQPAKISQNNNQEGQPAQMATAKPGSSIKANVAANQNTTRAKELNSPESKKPEANAKPVELITVAYAAPAGISHNNAVQDSITTGVPVNIHRDENDFDQAIADPKARPVEPQNVQADINTPVVESKAADHPITDSASLQPEMVLKPDSGSVDPKKIRVFTGISFNVSNQRIGTGLSLDVTFGKHFGITTGLTYNFLSEQQFPDRESMHGGPPHGFNPHINDHFGDKNHVSDIRIQSQLLQLPLAINYQVPLKHNYTLGFSLGTELDLYLYQQVSYTRHQDSTGTDFPHFGSRGNVVPFNCLYFGAGISKQWNHLLLNVQPYYNQRVKDLFYKPGEAEFGIGIKLMYLIAR